MSDKWIDSTGRLGQTVLECSVGDTVEICHSKYFKGAVADELVRGFRLSNPTLGSLSEENAGSWNCIRYLHQRPGKQIIEFIEDVSRRRSYIEVSGSIKVHDHASISQGGPAYATYYSELEEESEGG